ncbi:hypothetical protein ACU60T_24200 [Klebsiella aerogenes]
MQHWQLLATAGINARYNDNYSEITIYPGKYQPTEYAITGDYTSCSYLVAAATLSPCDLKLKNIKQQKFAGLASYYQLV